MTAELTLHAPAGPHPAGRPVPVRARLRNSGPGDLWIVGVVDGSDTGTRYPHWLPLVRLDGVVVAVPARPEDPLVGPLRTTDFRCLAPGGAMDPGPLPTFDTFAPEVPGTYVYSLDLSTGSGRPEAWLGTFNQDRSVLDLVARVPRLTLHAEATVEIAS
ncbi:hypothetical protein GCM10009557_45620 [Virgisporangium ochraceum]|uniref:Uncharacterized protein n=1 Tax=Virgisporangium ochraceum TaxID=65505 RepID=A0A8J4A806_9ACTN|nr:hypothetical protein [Virgisporangium ochraceum]GIJ75035.1 hypothetical protein Voc01_099520 [Virgisporangium ochraceum]